MRIHRIEEYEARSRTAVNARLVGASKGGTGDCERHPEGADFAQRVDRRIAPTDDEAGVFEAVPGPVAREIERNDGEPMSKQLILGRERERASVAG